MTWLKRTLDVAVLIGVLTQLVSITDLVLSQRQKEKLGSIIDEWALRLDYLKTVDWLRHWVTTTRRHDFAKKSIFAMWVLFLCGVAGVFIWHFTTPGAEHRDATVAYAVVVAFLCFGMASNIATMMLPDFIELMQDAKTTGDFLISYVVTLVTVGILLLGLVFFVGFPSLSSIMEPVAFTTRKYFQYAIGSLCLLWLAIFLDGAVTLLGALLLFASRGVIAFVRVLLWRIAEFPKGPLAAITLMLTAILGIVRIFAFGK